MLDVTEGEKLELTDLGESGGVGPGDAFLCEGHEELAENVIDVDGGEERAGEGFGELRAELLRFVELAFLAGVEDTEG